MVAKISIIPMAMPAMAPGLSLGPGEAGNVDAEYVNAEDVNIEDLIAEDAIAEDVIAKEDGFNKDDSVGCDVAIVASEPVPVDPDNGTTVSESREEYLSELSSSAVSPHSELRVCLH